MEYDKVCYVIIHTEVIETKLAKYQVLNQRSTNCDRDTSRCKHISDLISFKMAPSHLSKSLLRTMVSRNGDYKDSLPPFIQKSAIIFDEY